MVKRATKTVRIVFNAGNDPVSGGLVESFRKPGRRLTGTFSRSAELKGKRLELLKEMVPRLRRVVTSYNPDNRAAQQDVKGARPAVLPMEQSTRLEVTLDLKTAKTVVLRMPPSLLVCPDKVIQ